MTSREGMVVTMIMGSSSKEVMAVNISRVVMAVSSSLAMEHPLRIRASTSSQNLGLDHSNRGLGVQGAVSMGVGEVLVEVSLHLV